MHNMSTLMLHHQAAAIFVPALYLQFELIDIQDVLRRKFAEKPE